MLLPLLQKPVRPVSVPASEPSSFPEDEEEEADEDNNDIDTDGAVSPPVSPTLSASSLDEMDTATHMTDSLPLTRPGTSYNSMDKMAEQIQQLRERIQGENRKW